MDLLGMRIPSVFPRHDVDSSPEATAIRAVAEHCDIDDDEYYILTAIPPIKIFAAPDNGQTKVSHCDGAGKEGGWGCIVMRLYIRVY